MNQPNPGWGPLDTPIHDDPIPEGRPPWKDNAYIAFWDFSNDVYGCLHFSTSPNNVQGRRARFSFYAGGPNVEIIEPLERGTFCSASIDFDLAGIATIKHPRLSGRMVMKPRFRHADFCAKALPTLIDKPLQHFQITVEVEGDLLLDGKPVKFSALGIRDRTWGYREMSLNMPEYIWYFATFPDYSLTALRFRDIDGNDRTDGYLLTANETQRVVKGIGVTRDASGLSEAGEFTLADGSSFTLRSEGRRAGFWLPMEWARKGPAMSAYDEFCPLRRDDGTLGYGVVEHGQIRQLY